MVVRLVVIVVVVVVGALSFRLSEESLSCSEGRRRRRRCSRGDGQWRCRRRRNRECRRGPRRRAADRAGRAAGAAVEAKVHGAPRVDGRRRDEVLRGHRDAGPVAARSLRVTSEPRAVLCAVCVAVGRVWLSTGGRALADATAEKHHKPTVKKFSLYSPGLPVAAYTVEKARLGLFDCSYSLRTPVRGRW